MTRPREWLLIAVVAIIAAAAGFAWNVWRTAPESREVGGESLPQVRLPDLAGTVQALDQWKGNVVVLNFWATWCTPCREELPLFVRLQTTYGSRGLQFVGVAIDSKDKVQAFADELGLNFPTLLGGVEGVDLSRRLGNRAGVLPYTVVFDRSGRVVAREVGAVKPERIEPLVQSLL